MSRTAYVNGRYVPLRHAEISVEDRGSLFADSVYEVMALKDGRYLDFDGHLARLARSLAAIAIAAPASNCALRHIIKETVRQNGLTDALIYLQVTRGVARRDHAFPRPPVRPSLIVIARPISWAANDARAQTGVTVILQPDQRWKRCDIKSTGLLPNVLAREEAKGQGAAEAWFIDEDGFITEGASSNAWIVTGEGEIRTRALDHAVLPGITRASLLQVCADTGLRLAEQSFTAEEAKSAHEAFLTSTANFVMPVVKIDGVPIADGRPGPVTRQLRAAYGRFAAGV